MSTETTRVALVTGASRGIGRATALELASAGMHIAVNYCNSTSLAQAVVEEVFEKGQKAVAIQADMGKVEDIEALLREVEENFGRLDVLVNNAGVLEQAKPDQMTEEAWDRTFDVNVKGVFFTIRATAPLMRKNEPDADGIRGRIVNVSSVGGILATPASPHYGASKAAVIALTRNTAEWLAPEILVNCIAPGFVDTDMISGLHSIREEVNKQTPLGTWSRPEQVAKNIRFFAETAPFVTGQTLAVDGGIGNVYAYIPKKN